MPNVKRFMKDVYDGIESYRVYSSSGINQGDMAQWDDSSRYMTTNLMASGSIFLGITEEANPLASLGTTTQPLTGGRIRVRSGGIHFLTTTNGETYSHLEPVYSRTASAVTKVSATRMVGRVHLPLGNQVVGDGTNTVDISIAGSMTNAFRAPSSATGDR